MILDLNSSLRRSVGLILTMGVMISSQAQYAPAAGVPGTTAIPASADTIVMWASGCSVIRGLQDIAVPTSGYASAGDSSQAIGPAGGNTIVSLGDGGVATLTFAHPIVDRPGFDFAVFENGFIAGGPDMAFLELGFVEVSSDGLRFVRFPAVDHTQDSVQIANGGTMDASSLYNLAGKYTSGFGTPFDLAELRDSTGLDLQHITHVRVIDVVGALDDNFATHDSRGHKINDPYPTPFASSGFDLDAVGVMHADGISGVEDLHQAGLQVYPNPVSTKLYIQLNSNETAALSISDMSGRLYREMQLTGTSSIDVADLSPGIYTLNVTTDTRTFTHLIIKQ